MVGRHAIPHPSCRASRIAIAQNQASSLDWNKTTPVGCKRVEQNIFHLTGTE